ncbi:hypothetical protein ILYODFUR_024639 [Ilyodon furcidens]|uniref:Uncharacterized protein n=1 Tax=Ilyodon furcidens TaxID=33524 RepID=A0ABV0TD98_9TELE
MRQTEKHTHLGVIEDWLSLVPPQGLLGWPGLGHVLRNRNRSEVKGDWTIITKETTFSLPHLSFILGRLSSPFHKHTEQRSTSDSHQWPCSSLDEDKCSL